MYRVLPDEDAATNGDIRIVDESGEDYLYPCRVFYVFGVTSLILANTEQAPAADGPIAPFSRILLSSDWNADR